MKHISTILEGILLSILDRTLSEHGFRVVSLLNDKEAIIEYDNVTFIVSDIGQFIEQNCKAKEV